MRTMVMLLVALLAGCAQIPDGVQAVEGFDTQRYLGQWDEIARLDHRFERGLTNVTAVYTARDDGSIGVLNRGFDPEKGEWQQAEGRAKLAGEPGTAVASPDGASRRRLRADPATTRRAPRAGPGDAVATEGIRIANRTRRHGRRLRTG